VSEHRRLNTVEAAANSVRRPRPTPIAGTPLRAAITDECHLNNNFGCRRERQGYLKFERRGCCLVYHQLEGRRFLRRYWPQLSSLRNA
jgi:hypothetical protein